MPQEDLFQTIAARHGFALPEAYRYLWRKGFCTLEGPAQEHDFTRPGNGCLWVCEMEWYSLEEIADFRFDEIYEPHLPHLVPFAFNGAGDYWCWQTDRTDARGTRVLLCPHDYAVAKLYAPDFVAALFRQILQYACYESSTGADLTPNWMEDRAFFHRWAVDLVEVFPVQWIEIVRDLETRAPVHWVNRWGRPQVTRLSERERRAIEAEQIGFPEMDAEVKWLFG